MTSALLSSGKIMRRRSAGSDNPADSEFDADSDSTMNSRPVGKMKW